MRRRSAGRAERPEAAWSGGLGGWSAIGVSAGTGDGSGVGMGVGQAGGGAGMSGGTPVVRYHDLRVILEWGRPRRDRTG